MAHNERGPGPEGVCAPPVEEEDFYSQRLTAKNMTISSTTRANTKSVASSTNGIRLYSPFFPLLGGGVQVCEDEPGTRSGNPVDSLRREDRERTGLARWCVDPSKPPSAAHRPLLPKLKHI
jgi:hypothetical protein